MFFILFFLKDFDIFASIEPTEYVNIVFKLEERGGWANLIVFEKLFNREMWWVVTEICCEKNVYRRSKLIKKFIKIARHCRELRNFVSCFNKLGKFLEFHVCYYKWS